MEALRFVVRAANCAKLGSSYRIVAKSDPAWHASLIRTSRSTLLHTNLGGFWKGILTTWDAVLALHLRALIGMTLALRGAGAGSGEHSYSRAQAGTPNPAASGRGGLELGAFDVGPYPVTSRSTERSHRPAACLIS